MSAMWHRGWSCQIGVSLHNSYKEILDESGDTMYILLDGEIEVKFDMQRKILNESKLQDLIADLELSQTTMNKFLHARIGLQLDETNGS